MRARVTEREESTLLRPRTAEWLEEEYDDEEEKNLRQRRLRQQVAVPGGRPLEFDLGLSKDFFWPHPLKAGGRKGWRSTVVSMEKLPFETLWP